MGPRLFSRGYFLLSSNSAADVLTFQWGHDFSAVDTGHAAAGFGREQGVSMGPRLFSRGYDLDKKKKIELVDCFNGATTFQPWIRGILRWQRTQPLLVSMGPRLFSRGYFVWLTDRQELNKRFNGATTFQPWIHVPVYNQYTLIPSFQWGHDFSAVDTPRLGHWLPDRKLGFNGATTFQPWIRGQAPVVSVASTQVSMGPRLFSRGYCHFVAIFDRG